MAAYKILLAAGAAAAVIAGAALAQPPSAVVKAAVADPGRPAADTARDDNRKPAEVVAVSGLKPGEVVAELGSGGGYYTRILSKVIGPTGKLIAVVNPAALARNPKAADALNGMAAAYPNIVVVTSAYDKLDGLPQKVDMVWTTDNYHDYHNAMDTAVMDKAIYDALKPGGIFFVEDHAAAPGAGFTVTRTLHRIEPEVVKAEVESAGFKLIRQSDILKNPADDHLTQNAETAIRGHTDRFIMVFQKP
jgi:predicted methyltransferase